MPKLLNEQRLNKVQYISMSDYIRSMDALTDFEDKMAFTTRYLLAYGEGQQRDVSFAEAIHIARMKIADASMTMRKNKLYVSNLAVNPNVDDELDVKNRQFMIDPIGYLLEEADRLSVKESQNPNVEGARDRMEKYQLMSDILSNSPNTTLEYDIGELDVEPRATANNVRTRVKAYFGGNQELERAYKATKPGVLSKMFGTSSKAYANLEEVYKAYNNEDHALYDDTNALEKATREYLKHVFPRWDPEEGLPTQASLATLKGTRKARAEFSLGIYKSIVLEKKSKEVYDTIINSNLQKRADDLAKINDEEIDDNVNDFQENLLKDVNDNEVEIDDNPKAEEEYAANFADDPELGDD